MTGNPTTHGFFPLHILMDEEGRLGASQLIHKAVRDGAAVGYTPLVRDHWGIYHMVDVVHLRSENAELHRKVAAQEIDKKWLQRGIDQHKRAVQEEAQKVLDMEAKVEVLENLLDDARRDLEDAKLTAENRLAWVEDLKHYRDKVDRLNSSQARTIRELWERDSRKDAEIDALHAENARLAKELKATKASRDLTHSLLAHTRF